MANVWREIQNCFSVIYYGLMIFNTLLNVGGGEWIIHTRLEWKIVIFIFVLFEYVRVYSTGNKYYFKNYLIHFYENSEQEGELWSQRTGFCVLFPVFNNCVILESIWYYNYFYFKMEMFVIYFKIFIKSNMF